MSDNRLKNAITLDYLKGNKNVYRISSPDKKHHVLVNKNSLLQLVKSNYILNSSTLNRLVGKKFSGHTVNAVARFQNHGPGRRPHNYPWASYLSMNMYGRNGNYIIPLSNYTFETLQGNYGIQKVRNPVGYTPYLMLKNVNKNKLTNANLRELRLMRRQNTKNTAEALKKAKNKIKANANKRKANMQQRATRTLYRVIVISTNNNNRETTHQFWVNSNGVRIAPPRRESVMLNVRNNNSEMNNVYNKLNQNYYVYNMMRYRRV